MNRVRRFDRIELCLDKAEKLSTGWLKADAVIGRVGVFPYTDADGRTVVELRDPADVFDAEAMRSFELLPLTNEHPPVALDGTNARAYAVGHVGNDVRQDGDHLRATVMITDAATVAVVESGKTELSPGYTVELVPTQGTFRGAHYDARQTNIRGNHVARVDQGRQGPEVSIRLDAGDAVAAPDNGVNMLDKENGEPREDAKTKKIKIGDDEHEVPSAVASAWNKQTKRIESLEAKLEKFAGRKDEDESDKLRARLDAVEAENKALRDGEATRIDARVSLLSTAREVCGPDFSAEGKTDAEIMAAVVASVRPDAKLEGKSDGYIAGAFEHALEVHRSRKDHGDRLLEVATSAETKTKTDTAEAARLKANAERENAYKGAKE